MIYIEQAAESGKGRLVTETFYGLDRRKKIADGAFSDMLNMTCEDYPIIRTRDKYSGTIAGISSCSIAKRVNWDGDIVDAIVSVSSDGVLSVTYEGDNGIVTDSVDYHYYLQGCKQLVSIGNYLVAFPSGRYADCDNDLRLAWDSINVKRSCVLDGSTYGLIIVGEEAAFGGYSGNYTGTIYSGSGTVKVVPCSKSGTEYTAFLGKSDTEPTDGLQDGAIWIKTETVSTSGEYTEQETLMVYSSASESFVVTEPYFKVSMPSTSVGTEWFSIGDTINFKPEKYQGNITIDISSSGSIPGVTVNTLKAQLLSLEGSNSVVGTMSTGSTPYVILTGLIDAPVYFKVGGVTLERQMPTLDYVCECNNRLWGCRYGYTYAPGMPYYGESVNELYCCALGDPKNWYKYQGLSTDSWAASCGTEGPWTGCANVNGYPTFFKRDSISRIYVSNTGAHQVVSTLATGIQDGSWKSVAMISGIAYYKGDDGVYAYDGGFPVMISSALGASHFTGAVAGSIGRVLFMSMASGASYSTYAYDVDNGTWCRVDDKQHLSLVRLGNKLVSNHGVLIDQTAGTELASTESWSLTSGIEYYGSNSSKKYSYKYPPSAIYYSKYSFRMRLSSASTVKLYMEYDSSGEWELEGEATGEDGLGVILIPVMPRRCDHLRYRLVGTGYAELWTISRTMEAGSEV